MTLTSRKEFLKNINTAIIKIGSSVLTDEDGFLDESVFKKLAEQISSVKKKGINVVVVSSGAIASGMKKLGILKKPEDIHMKQAISACGQTTLIRNYEVAFSEFGNKVAQVLLTHDALSNRKRFLNARKTVQQLLEMDIIPIINENDTVSFEEIMFGDNDNLAALITTLVEADILILLSNTDGIFDFDPKKSPNAKLIPMIKEVDSTIEKIAGGTTGRTTTGGMKTKVLAAKAAAAFGVPSIIANGKDEKVLDKLFNYEDTGSFILPSKEKLNRRKHWIAYTLKPSGKIFLDEGAANAVAKNGKSLLSSGITNVEGNFEIGEPVSCYNSEKVEICRGLTSYNSYELRQIMGKKSSEIENILGYKYGDAVIHRDEMAIVSKK